mgnify:CR=1 FL=1
MIVMKKLALGTAILIATLTVQSQCSFSPNNIYSFTANGVQYEIVKEVEYWNVVAACAFNRGGHLAEINSQLEQDSIYYHLTQAGINTNSTKAPDGGNAAYVWLGGNDAPSEGRWEWDGDNSGMKVHFYQGQRNGNAINGLYNNWGNEPDNFNNNQHCLGLALTSWPFGTLGEWNDINCFNSLYYIIEFPSTSTGLIENKKDLFQVYPNPINDVIMINSTKQTSYKSTLRVINLQGKVVIEEELSPSINVSDWKSGNYILQILDNSEILFQEIITIQH